MGKFCDDKFVSELPSNTDESLELICLRFLAWEKNIQQSVRPMHIDDYLDAWAFLRAFFVGRNTGMGLPELDFNEPHEKQIKLIEDTFKIILSTCRNRMRPRRLSETMGNYERMLGTAFLYEFSDADVANIQKIVNDLRNVIQDAEQLEDEHRRRLLLRLEKLQKELHKKVSDLDRFWGMVGDGLVVARKMREQAQPMMGLIKKLLDIVWKAQTAAEGLPPGALPPLLPDTQEVSVASEQD